MMSVKIFRLMKTTKSHEINVNKIIVINSAMKITIFFMINSHRGILYVYKLSNNCTYINIGTVRELVLYFGLCLNIKFSFPFTALS